MQKQFNAQFKKLFKNSSLGLQKALNLKFRAIQRVDKKNLIIPEKEYRQLRG